MLYKLKLDHKGVFMKLLKKNAFLLALIISFIFFAYFGYSYFIGAKIHDEQILAKEKMDAYLDDIPIKPKTNGKATLAFRRSKLNKKRTEELYSFRTEYGTEFWSFSEKWDVEKLKLLNEELLKNRHGEEIETLDYVVVYPNSNDTIAGSHQNYNWMQTLSFDFPAIPSEVFMVFRASTGRISLYDGDQNTTIESMSRVLSHEYGHHYTFHYFFNSEDTEQSDYAKIRDLPEDARFVWEYSDDYVENHHWYAIEIAAEDYVQLMGSETTRKIVYYKDVMQQMNGQFTKPYFRSSNIEPQENLMIPLASEVDGLYEYFYHFIDENASAPELAEKKTITIKIDPRTSSYNSTVGMLYFTSYKITWNDVYAGQGVVYTLLSYDPNNYFIRPIKTIAKGNALEAYVGTTSYQTTDYIYHYPDGLDKGTRVFLVLAQFPDGSIRISDPLTYRFK